LQRSICDHGTALYRPDVDAQDLAAGLAEVLSEGSIRSVYLNNFPVWDRSREACEKALALCGWPSWAIDASADPVLAEAPGPELARRLISHVHGKSLRNYSNRLKKIEGYAFEVLEDATDLSSWAADFCDCHDWRWSSSTTPSNLASPTQRKDFEDTLRAWVATGTLIRFAIRIGQERVALAVVLRAGDRLIYHRIAHSPAHSHTRASTVLIRKLVLWMAQKEQPTLDFGLGDEQYKYRFSTREERLWRVYGSRSRFSGSWFAGAVEAKIRSAPSLQKNWDRIGNGWIRGHLQAKLRRVRTDFRKSAAKLAGCHAPDIWSVALPDATTSSLVHHATGRADVPELACHLLSMAEVFRQIEGRWPLAIEERRYFYERNQAGWAPHALRHGNLWGPVAWLRADPHHDGNWWVRSNESKAAHFRPSQTRALLQSLRSLAGPQRRIFVESGAPGGFEISDLRVAGFEPAQLV
jgi:hypothetical protein